MKKRIPVLSVVLFTYLLVRVWQKSLNLVDVLPLALSVMALFAQKKTKLSRIAGFVALGWTVLILLENGRDIYFFRSYIQAIFPAITGLIAGLFLLAGSISVITKKPGKIKPVHYFLLGLLFGFASMLIRAYWVISGGSASIVYIFFVALSANLSFLLMYGASALLYSTFVQPQEAPYMDKKKIKILAFMVITTCVMLGVASMISQESSFSGNDYSAADYIKEHDPELYNDLVERYNSLIP